MRKLMALALSLASIGFVASNAGAKTNASTMSHAGIFASPPQGRFRIRPNERNNTRFNHRVRTVTQSRIVRYGWHMFRETYQITYWPNGRTQTRLISRVRIR